MKANNEKTIDKKPKIYTGIRWIISDKQLTNEYQVFEFISTFKFTGSSKYRVGLDKADFKDSLSIRNIVMT